MFANGQKILINYQLLEIGWTFANFHNHYKFDECFLILEEDIKSHHGCINNLKMYFDVDKRSMIQYKFNDKICDVFEQFVERNGKKELTIYYEYDNGYEWPLLSF